jgi:hypothetical protein
MKTRDIQTATRRVNRMSRKISDNRRKAEKSVMLPYVPHLQNYAPQYKREDIESILTGTLLVSIGIAAVLLSVTLLITVIKD